MPLEFGVAFRLSKSETMSCDEAQLLIELLYLHDLHGCFEVKIAKNQDMDR